jgi:hypothetical protein
MIPGLSADEQAPHPSRESRGRAGHSGGVWVVIVPVSDRYPVVGLG